MHNRVAYLRGICYNIRMKTSAIALAALAAAMLSAGCAHERTIIDDKPPEITITADRHILYGRRTITLKELPERLADDGFSPSRTLPIRVENLHDLRAANDVLIYLRLKGWTRAVVVTDRHGSSSSRYSQQTGPQPSPPPTPMTPQPRQYYPPSMRRR